MKTEFLIAGLMFACFAYASIFEMELLKLSVHRGVDISERYWFLQTSIPFQLVYGLMLLIEVAIPAYFGWSFLQPHRSIFKDMFKEEYYGIE